MKSAQYQILVLHSLRIRFVTELYQTTTVFYLQKYHPDPDPHINILSIGEIADFFFDINQWETRRRQREGKRERESERESEDNCTW